MKNARRMFEALSLSLRTVAERASSASAQAPSFGVQTGRAGGALNKAGLADLLLLGVLLLPAAPALAQSQIIVSNLGEERAFFGLDGGISAATPFTTGQRAGGYTLVAAAINFLGSTGGITVSIYDASNNLPGESIGTLDGLTLVSAGGNHTYTSSVGIPLDTSTTYYLVVNTSGEGSGVSLTPSTNQDTTDGWDIVNTSFVIGDSGIWLLGVKTSGLRFSLSVLPPLSFGSNTIPHQTYVVGTVITDFTLPTASGSGLGNNSYTLEPEPPDGLSFDSNSNPPVLSGEPTTVMAAATYTYTAAVASSSTSLNFTIRVLPPDAVKLRLRVFLEGPLQ